MNRMLRDPEHDEQQHDDVRYRLFVPAHHTEIRVVCVQWFDYPDYHGTFLPGWFDENSERQAEQLASWLQNVLDTGVLT